MQISGAEKCFVGEQCRILGQESALLVNNAEFWGRKVLCGATMPISGYQKAFPFQEVQPPSDHWRDSDFYTEYLSTQF